MSRSATIAQAVRREISSPDAAAARVDELLTAGRAALSDTGAWSVAELVRDQLASH